MPIPVYEQRTRASQAGLGPGPMDTGRGLGALGQAVGQIGGMLAEKKEIARRKEEADAVSAAHLAATRASAEWSQTLDERARNMEPGAAGFTPSLLKDFDAYRTQGRAAITNDLARRYYDEQTEALRGRLQTQALTIEAAEGIRFRGQQMIEAGDQARIAVRADPDTFDDHLAALGAALEAANLPPKERDRIWQDKREGLAASAVESLIERDPRRTLKALTAAPGESGISAIETLSADGRERARSVAEAELRRREMEAKVRAAEARDLLREAEADAFAAKAAGLTAVLPTRAQYVAAYGEEGASRYAQSSRLFSVYDTVSAAVELPPEEGARLIASYRPTQQEGAAAAAEVQRTAVNLYQQQRKMLEADPAAGIMARDEQSRALFAAAAEGDAGAAQQYVQRVRSRAAAMGLSGNILPKVAVDNLSTDLAFDPESPRRRTETLQALRQQWGRYYPQVVREIAPKLEGDARIVAEMRPESARQYDSVVAQGRDKVMGLLSSDQKRQVQEASREALAPVVETLLSNPDAEARINEHLEAVQLLTASMVNRGADPTDAAERAADLVIRERYSFRDSMRIPAGLDADELAGAADRVRARIDPKALAVRPMASSTMQEAQLDLADRIRKEGAWFTTADDSGVELRVPVQGTMKPVVLTNGRRLRLTWDELQAPENGPDARALRPYDEGMR